MHHATYQHRCHESSLDYSTQYKYSHSYSHSVKINIFIANQLCWLGTGIVYIMDLHHAKWISSDVINHIFGLLLHNDPLLYVSSSNNYIMIDVGSNKWFTFPLSSVSIAFIWCSADKCIGMISANHRIFLIFIA